MAVDQEQRTLLCGPLLHQSTTLTLLATVPTILHSLPGGLREAVTYSCFGGPGAKAQEGN